MWKLILVRAPQRKFGRWSHMRFRVTSDMKSPRSIERIPTCFPQYSGQFEEDVWIEGLWWVAVIRRLFSWPWKAATSSRVLCRRRAKWWGKVLEFQRRIYKAHRWGWERMVREASSEDAHGSDSKDGNNNAMWWSNSAMRHSTGSQSRTAGRLQPSASVKLCFTSNVVKKFFGKKWGPYCLSKGGFRRIPNLRTPPFEGQNGPL